MPLLHPCCSIIRTSYVAKKQHQPSFSARSWTLPAWCPWYSRANLRSSAGLVSGSPMQRWESRRSRHPGQSASQFQSPIMQSWPRCGGNWCGTAMYMFLSFLPHRGLRGIIPPPPPHPGQGGPFPCVLGLSWLPAWSSLTPHRIIAMVENARCAGAARSKPRIG